MKKSIFFTFLILAFTARVNAQYSPSIHNYSIAEYKAGNQNWDVTRAKDGKVYVANNSGLLVYDAMVWDFYQLPNKTIVRSVLAVDDFIFTGSYQEFGYWKQDDYGVLRYTSLSDEVKDIISPNEEIWQIVKYQDCIIFRTFSNIYIYDYKEVAQLKPNSIAISCSVVDNQLYVATLNRGIFQLVDDQLKPFFNHNKLENTKVIAIEAYEDKLLLTTSLKGSFFLKNNELANANFKVDESIRQHQLNEFSILNDGRMIFSTIKDGVYITDHKGVLIFHISKENSLINNTVLGQFVDEEKNLWLGLDNGIASIDLNSPNYFFNDVSGKLGAVYDIISYDDKIYIGSNTGLFVLNEFNNLNFIEGSQGQVWDLSIIEGELFCGHNEGTFIVKNETLDKISDFTGGWTIQKVPERSKTYIQGTYTGLVRFEKVSGQWNVKHLGTTTIPSRFVVFENPLTAWVAHAYKGLFRIKFDEDYDEVISIENYQNKGINSDYNLRVYNIKNNISFKTNDGWQKYEPILDSIIPYKLLNEELGKDNYIISDDNEEMLALKNNNGYIGFKSFLKDYSGPILNDRFFSNRYIVGYERMSKLRDSTYALNLDNGFMVIDEGFNEQIELKRPEVEAVVINGEHIKTAEVTEENELNLKHNQNLYIEITSPRSSNHFFEYNIPEIDDDWYKMDANKLELSNLKQGSISLNFRTSNIAGYSSPIQTLNFSISPPWYKGTLGFVMYSLLAVITIILVRRIQRKKVIREQRRIMIKYQREQQKLLREKTLEGEKRIVQLKNETLQSEIKLKSKQLANNAMALVKKNEVLQDIKKELASNKENFKNYYNYKKLVRKIDHSIEHKDEWEVFEENFNQVHDEFFENLKRKHPKLTPKDLKVCAYLKMNLSNKEIAPLMNISVRGVETHRYRLKKKLNLENDISLTDYLLNLK